MSYFVLTKKASTGFFGGDGGYNIITFDCLEKATEYLERMGNHAAGCIAIKGKLLTTKTEIVDEND